MAQPSVFPSYQMSIPPFTPFTPAAYGRSSSPLNPQSHPPSSSPLTSPTPIPATKSFRPFSIAHSGVPAGDAGAVGSSRPLGRMTDDGRTTAGESSSAGESRGEGSFMSLYTPVLRSKRPAAAPRQSLPSHTLASRPTAQRARSSPSSPTYRMSSDIFSDPSSSTSALGPTGISAASASASGPSPLQGQMWRDRLDRRMNERERRTQARHQDLARRRGLSENGDMSIASRIRRGVRGSGAEVSDEEWDEEAERQQAAEDEEVYRRLMLSQRRKAQHAAMVSYERETGGSDPLLPEFWDDGEETDDMSDTSQHRQHIGETRSNVPHIRHTDAYSTPSRLTFPFSRETFSHTPCTPDISNRTHHRPDPHADLNEDALEAEAAEAALAERIEREMAEQAQPLSSRTSELGSDDDDMDVEYDWEALDQLEQAAAARRAGHAQVQCAPAEMEGGGHGGVGEMDVDM